MLNWENFVIQQEKMQKLREDIMSLSSKAEAKLTLMDTKNQSLRENVKFFDKICFIVSTCQTTKGSRG